jgi:hypothetical protein
LPKPGLPFPERLVFELFLVRRLTLARNERLNLVLDLLSELKATETDCRRDSRH